MEMIGTIALVVLGIIIVVSNWERINGIIINIGKKSNNNKNESIEISKEDIKRMTTERMQQLMNERERRVQKIEELTSELKAEIKEIDIEIYLLKGDKK